MMFGAGWMNLTSLGLGLAAWALPLAALFLVWRVKVQGFSFSAGLRGGMEPLAVFTSLPYTVCVLFLMGLTVYLYRVG